MFFRCQKQPRRYFLYSEYLDELTEAICNAVKVSVGQRLQSSYKESLSHLGRLFENFPPLVG